MTQVTDLRQALEERLPLGPMFTINVAIDTGVASITANIGSLRWERPTGIGDATVEHLAEDTVADLKSYLRAARASIQGDEDSAMHNGRPVRLRRSGVALKNLLRSDPRVNEWLNRDEAEPDGSPEELHAA